MADDFPDLHHRLCKQVAALTTAIYFLNTKNDENELVLQTHLEAYEQEMNNIVQSANQAIDNYIQSNNQAFELHKIQTAYRSFKSQIEGERSSSIQEYNAFQERIEKKEREIKEEADKEINGYKLEVESLKEKIWQMQKVVEKVSGDKIQFDEEEHKAKERENLRMKKELEEKQIEVSELRIKCDELERMYKELEENRITTGRNWGRGSLGVNTEGSGPEDWELDMLRSKLAEQDRLIIALKKALTQENGMSDGDYIASIEFGASSRREMSTLGIQPNNLQRQLLESDRIILEKQDEFMKVQDQLQVDASDDKSDDKIQQIIEEYENRLKEASREHRKMIEKLHNEYSENIAEMENQFEKENIKWQAHLQGMQNTLDNRNEYINGLEERIRDLELAKEKLTQEIQTKDWQHKQEIAINEEIRRLQQLLDEAWKLSAQKLEVAKRNAEEEKLHALEDMKQENEKRLQALRDDFSNRKSASEVQKEAKIRELETEIERLKQYPLEQLEAKSKEIAEDYQNKVNELSKRQNGQIRELMEKHEEKMGHITKIYENELSNIKKELQKEKDSILKRKEEDKNSEITHVKKDYEAQLKKISKSYDKQLAEKLQEYEAKIKNKETEILDLRAEINNAKEEIKLAFEKSKTQELNYKEMQKLLEDQKTTIDTLQDEIREGILEEGGPTFRKEFNKIKEGELNNKGKEEMIVEHLKYADKVEKKLIDLKRDYEERMRLWAQKYDELLAIFESRPSKTEDLEKIKQLEEELKKESEKFKQILPESLKKDDFHVFTPQTSFQTSFQASFSGQTLTNSFKIKKNSKTMSMSPPNINTSLPPISINQFSIQIRTPPAINPLTTTKKFFK